MELVVFADDQIKAAVAVAQRALSLNDWRQTVSAMGVVNNMLLHKLINACDFGDVHKGIDPLLVNVLDVLRPGKFEPNIWFPTEDKSYMATELQQMIGERQGTHEATAGQFLSYVARNKQAGMDCSLMFPPLAGHSWDLGAPACMYVHKRNGYRRLGLANLDWKRRTPEWQVFSVSK